MELSNLYISPLNSLTPTQRAMAISAELLAISLPPSARHLDDSTTHLFDWNTHPTTGEAVLQVDLDKPIYVHPQNNLQTLISLLPPMPLAEMANKVGLIVAGTFVRFGDLIPSTATYITNEQMQQEGWFV